MSSDYVIVLNVIQVFLLLLLGLASLYIFLFSFAGLFYRQPEYTVAGSVASINIG